MEKILWTAAALAVCVTVLKFGADKLGAWVQREEIKEAVAEYREVLKARFAKCVHPSSKKSRKTGSSLLQYNK